MAGGRRHAGVASLLMALTILLSGAPNPGDHAADDSPFDPRSDWNQDLRDALARAEEARARLLRHGCPHASLALWWEEAEGFRWVVACEGTTPPDPLPPP